MSRNYGSTAYEINFLIHEVQAMSSDEATMLYGIEFRENGKIFDPTFSMEFVSIGEWAAFSVENDQSTIDEKFHDYGDNE